MFIFKKLYIGHQVKNSGSKGSKGLEQLGFNVYVQLSSYEDHKLQEKNQSEKKSGTENTTMKKRGNKQIALPQSIKALAQARQVRSGLENFECNREGWYFSFGNDVVGWALAGSQLIHVLYTKMIVLIHDIYGVC